MKGTRTEALKYAKSGLGTTNGNFIRAWYNKNIANLGTTLWFWCCATIVYILTMAGVDVCHTASASEMLNYYKKKNRYRKKGEYTPKPADIIEFDYIKNDGKPCSHIGMVEYVKNGYVHTIEGNSGSSQDGAWLRHCYSLNYEYIVGYCIPEYKSETKDGFTYGKKVFFKKEKNIYKADGKTRVKYSDLNSNWKKACRKGVTGKAVFLKGKSTKLKKVEEKNGRVYGIFGKANYRIILINRKGKISAYQK